MLLYAPYLVVQITPVVSKRYCYCLFVFQFAKDFVNDCRDLLSAFFFDPFRSVRLADRLEEDLVHHASVLSKCNSYNVAFKLVASKSSQMISDLTNSYTIAGTF